MAVAFDGVAKSITVTGTAIVNNQQNIYSEWKNWVRASDNAKYEQALRPIGGDNIGDGNLSPAFFFLMNNWKIYIDGINVKFTVNLYCEEASNDNYNPFVITGNGSAINEMSNSPIVTVSSGSGLSTEEHNQVMKIATKNEIANEVLDEVSS